MDGEKAKGRSSSVLTLIEGTLCTMCTQFLSFLVFSLSLSFNSISHFDSALLCFYVVMYVYWCGIELKKKKILRKLNRTEKNIVGFCYNSSALDSLLYRCFCLFFFLVFGLVTAQLSSLIKLMNDLLRDCFFFYIQISIFPQSCCCCCCCCS